MIRTVALVEMLFMVGADAYNPDEAGEWGLQKRFGNYSDIEDFKWAKELPPLEALQRKLKFSKTVLEVKPNIQAHEVYSVKLSGHQQSPTSTISYGGGHLCNPLSYFTHNSFCSRHTHIYDLMKPRLQRMRAEGTSQHRIHVHRERNK